MVRRVLPMFLAPLLLAPGCANGTLSTIDGPDRCADKVGMSSAAIIGGSATSAHEAVVYLTDAIGEAFCTGTVIAERRVLTAAHCLEGGGPTHVAFGPSDRMPSRSVPVASMAAHPSFDPSSLDNDVAYLDLATPAGVVPIPVLYDAPRPGWTVTLVGYGVDDGVAQTGAGLKRETTVRIDGIQAVTWSSGFSGTGSCNGDSGGPALYTGAGGPAVVGVTSWGDELCREDGYYARVDLHAAFLGTSGAPPVGPPPTSGGALCTDSCEYAFDGECDDGGPGADYAVCALGSDCADCGGRDSGAAEPAPPAEPDESPPTGSTPPTGDAPPEGTPPPTSGPRCDDGCPSARDGECDDGGPGSLCGVCGLGTDCSDCGAR